MSFEELIQIRTLNNQTLQKNLITSAEVMDTTNDNSTTPNSFECLSESDGSETHIKVNKKIKESIPPIVVQGMTFNTIKNLFETNGIKQYQIKIISVGIKIIVNNASVYNTVKQLLNSNKTEHFTYRATHERPLKIKIIGLPHCMETNDIKQSLISQGIDEKDILNIQKIYKPEERSIVRFMLAHFNRQKVSIQVLKKIKAINQVIVKFEQYYQVRNSPTQCRRCQMFGHGSSYCFKIEKCFKCNGPHAGSNCSIAPINAKCANCNGRHFSNDKECPKRKEYLIIQENVQINNKIQNFKGFQTKKVNKEAPTMTNDDFPKLNPPKQTPAHSAWNKKFQYNLPTLTPKPSMINSTETGNENLFSLDEITNLVGEIIHNLSTCKTKAEQFTVITQLSVKYLYGGK